MCEKEVVEAIRRHVSRRGSDWRFVYGREVLTKEEFLRRLDTDRAFRRTIVAMVLSLSADLLTRDESAGPGRSQAADT